MKFTKSNNYIMRSIVGENVLIPVGEAAQDINGMIHFSDVAMLIWNKLEEVTDVDQLVEAIIDEYEVTPDEARTDALAFLKVLIDNTIVTYEE